MKLSWEGTEMTGIVLVYSVFHLVNFPDFLLFLSTRLALIVDSSILYVSRRVCVCVVVAVFEIYKDIIYRRDGRVLAKLNRTGSALLLYLNSVQNIKFYLVH